MNSRLREQAESLRLFYVCLSLGERGSFFASVPANSRPRAIAQGKSKAYEVVPAHARKDVQLISVKEEVDLCA
jgi:hypothetical protein